MDQPARKEGFVYVLATAYSSDGKTIIKIGMTTRPPKARVAELSRGGPAGMQLVGYVPCADRAKLERAAHFRFRSHHLRSNGGTEYFTANPKEVMDWLRANTPRLSLEAARKDAWAEYIETKPFKTQNRAMLLYFMVAILLPCGAFFIQPISVWNYLIALAATWVGAYFLAKPIGDLPFMVRQRAKLEKVKSDLEAKYHLPPGGLHY